LKLVERGQMREDLWRLLLLNTRAPNMLDGDVRAMIGSTEVGAERLAQLVEELGVDRTEHVFEAILAYADRRLRSCIERLEPGVHRVEEPVDHDCFSEIDARIALPMTVEDSRLIFDFEGTSPQVRGFKN